MIESTDGMAGIKGIKDTSQIGVGGCLVFDPNEVRIPNPNEVRIPNPNPNPKEFVLGSG